jgi:hypothetical protein
MLAEEREDSLIVSVRVFGRHGVCELPATTIVEGTF